MKTPTATLKSFAAPLSACLLTVLMFGATTATAAPAKLTSLIGHPVMTDASERLGNVEDFAIDAESGRIQYVVISIGSFLVEKSLIAVQPSALSPAKSGDPLVLRMEDLEVAHRFNADNWPDAADVRSADAPRDSASSGSTGSSTPVLSSSGKATITSGAKKATYEDGKRELVNGPMRRAKPTTPSPQSAPKVVRVVPNFKNLDRNRDGRLSRAEIGAELNQRSGFKDLDIDSSGSIDDFEYSAYQERLASERRWAGNR